MGPNVLGYRKASDIGGINGCGDLFYQRGIPVDIRDHDGDSYCLCARCVQDVGGSIS
ncbi:hypothetical protein Godav_005183 [Gossypium davidsonii]|uniref:Uncharacterized protein n=1 Tax=Gossypium davidsonii TaxID=34287 RepID=A0A7J8TCC4_GOSDV|nr:hypothetical protein [Gossypium davidsonii]